MLLTPELVSCPTFQLLGSRVSARTVQRVVQHRKVEQLYALLVKTFRLKKKVMNACMKSLEEKREH